MMKRLRYKYYNNRITNLDYVNVQSHDQEVSKSNSTINANSGAHTLANCKIIKSPLNKNYVATIKSKQNKNLITGECQIGAVVPM